MKHLAQSLHTLLVEGSVELMDSIVCRLWITAEVAVNPVGVPATVACEQDLATAQDEGIR
jgi:hypothetical protein